MSRVPCLRNGPKLLHQRPDEASAMMMNGVIEALHIYDDNRNPILSHTYTGRPLSAAHLLPLYLEHPAPRPNLIYLPNTSPPTLVFSLTHANLLLLVTASTEIEPLLVFEFLHRVIDALEDFLGAPILALKIESSYDVVAQLLTEMCDAGTICTTEPNALREVVELEGWVGKLLGSINLPGNKPSTTNFANSSSPSLSSSNTPALPWRRANVRHTSNELYADIVETLTVTLAPSGRPLAAFANGTIAFTSKVSGLPDVVVTLTSPSGKHNIGGIMELPVFHPCVRLNRWKEKPGELSFIPPDGRFILAGYEVDLLPFTSGKSGNMASNNLKLPVSMEVKTGLGTTGSDFEVRLQVNKVVGAPSPSSSGQFGRGSGGGRLGGPHAGSPAAPQMNDLTITIPLPADVRNLSEIRPSKGDASFNPGDKILEWHIPAKELSGGTSYFGLRCTVVGPLVPDDDQESDPNGFGFGNDYSYSEPYQSVPVTKTAQDRDKASDDKDAKKVAHNKILMPSSASVSFSVKGWLASGLRVESIMIDARKSRGIGEGIKPYKGVKYLTVSKGGVEIRCEYARKLHVTAVDQPHDPQLPLRAPEFRAVGTRDIGYKRGARGASRPGTCSPEAVSSACPPPSAHPRLMAHQPCHGHEHEHELPQRHLTTLLEAGTHNRQLLCRAPDNASVTPSLLTLQLAVERQWTGSRRLCCGAAALRACSSCRELKLVDFSLEDLERWADTAGGGLSIVEAPGPPSSSQVGQGVQRVGMLTPWIEAFPNNASHLLQEIDDIMGYKLSDIIQNGPSTTLNETPNAQPAIMATSIFILRMLEREFNFKVTDHFDVTLGHSLGEFAALTAGGYISFEDSLYLVRKRAEAMSEATRCAIENYGGEYGMVAVITHPEHMAGLIDAVRDFVGYSSQNMENVPPIDQVSIANINSKNQIVLSGNMERIRTLIAHLRQFLGHDPRAVRLKSDSPFHSPIMKPAVAVMKTLLNEKSRQHIRAPFRSREELQDLVARGCLDTVRWWASIRYLDQEEKIRRWVGVGPGKVGRNLVGKEVGMRGKDLVKGGGVWAITDPSEVEEVLRGLEDTEGIMEEDDQFYE
ncbi:hypothetical protein G7046_g9981 [Stylonectria norvegica]|nr:hypothetical protein G7046_g9981 [Stylonectria norvegica]